MLTFLLSTNLCASVALICPMVTTIPRVPRLMEGGGGGGGGGHAV